MEPVRHHPARARLDRAVRDGAGRQGGGEAARDQAPSSKVSRTTEAPMKPKPIKRICGCATWNLAPGVVLMARIQGGGGICGHVRWTVTMVERDITIGVTRGQAKELLMGVEQ